jgi:YVTN family beta-propeller protein
MDTHAIPPLGDEGLVFVYLEPLPQEADVLRMKLASVAAVLEDGRTVDLTLAIGEAGGPGPRRERLLAWGRVPPGRCTGVSVTMASAARRRPGGEEPMSLPGAPSHAAVPFAVAGRRAVVIDLAFLYRDSLSGGDGLNPAFAASIPGTIATGLIGCATNAEWNTLTIFDKVTGRVMGVVPTGRQPRGIALEEARNRAYVALAGEDGIAVVDLLERRIIDRLGLQGGDRPVDLALTPDARTLVSADRGSSTASIVDPRALFETNRIRVGDGPGAVLINASGTRAFIFNTLSDSISVINLGGSGAAATIGTDSGPVRGRFNRDESRLYVIHRNSPYLSVVSPAGLSVQRRVYLGSGASAIAVHPLTGLIYIARRGSAGIDVYDASSLLPIDSISVGSEVADLEIDTESNTLLAVLPALGVVRRIALISRQTTGEIEVGKGAAWVAFMGER